MAQEKTKRNKAMVAMRQKGYTFAAVGKKFGVSPYIVSRAWYRHLKVEGFVKTATGWKKTVDKSVK